MALVSTTVNFVAETALDSKIQSQRRQPLSDIMTQMHGRGEENRIRFSHIIFAEPFLFLRWNPDPPDNKHFHYKANSWWGWNRGKAISNFLVAAGTAATAVFRDLQSHCRVLAQRQQLQCHHFTWRKTEPSSTIDIKTVWRLQALCHGT